MWWNARSDKERDPSYLLSKLHEEKKKDDEPQETAPFLPSDITGLANMTPAADKTVSKYHTGDNDNSNYKNDKISFRGAKFYYLLHNVIFMVNLYVMISFTFKLWNSMTVNFSTHAFVLVVLSGASIVLPLFLVCHDHLNVLEKWILMFGNVGRFLNVLNQMLCLVVMVVLLFIEICTCCIVVFANGFGDITQNNIVVICQRNRMKDELLVQYPTQMILQSYLAIKSMEDSKNNDLIVSSQFLGVSLAILHLYFAGSLYFQYKFNGNSFDHIWEHKNKQ